MTNDSYLPVIVLLLAALAFTVLPLALAWLWAKKFSPRKPGPSKNAIYECGLESADDAWIQFKPGYYLYAIIFLIFDVEAIFLAAVRRGIYRSDVGSVHRHDGLSAFAGRRAGLGVSERRAGLDCDV